MGNTDGKGARKAEEKEEGGREAQPGGSPRLTADALADLQRGLEAEDAEDAELQRRLEAAGVNAEQVRPAVTQEEATRQPKVAARAPHDFHESTWSSWRTTDPSDPLPNSKTLAFQACMPEPAGARAPAPRGSFDQVPEAKDRSSWASDSRNRHVGPGETAGALFSFAGGSAGGTGTAPTSRYQPEAKDRSNRASDSGNRHVGPGETAGALFPFAGDTGGGIGTVPFSFKPSDAAEPVTPWPPAGSEAVDDRLQATLKLQFLGPRAASKLEQVLREDPFLEVRQVAAATLADLMQDPSSAQISCRALSAALESDPDASIRRMIAGALGSVVGGDVTVSAAALLLAHHGDSDADVRRISGQSLKLLDELTPWRDGCEPRDELTPQATLTDSDADARRPPVRSQSAPQARDRSADSASRPPTSTGAADFAAKKSALGLWGPGRAGGRHALDAGADEESPTLGALRLGGLARSPGRVDGAGPAAGPPTITKNITPNFGICVDDEIIDYRRLTDEIVD